MDTLGYCLGHHRRLVGNSRRLDNLVGREDFLFSMLAFLPLYSVVVHELLVLICYLRHVTHEHVETLFLGQNSSTCTALSCS